MARSSIAVRLLKALLGVVLLICTGTRCGLAQAPAEATKASAAAYDPAVEAANRKALEDEAGRNAGKLMLRSVPDKSPVLINGKPVGKTPLLLIVRPGVYVVEMEGGPRAGYGRQQVDLLPKENREVLIKLQPRYPAYVRLPTASH